MPVSSGSLSSYCSGRQEFSESASIVFWMRLVEIIRAAADKASVIDLTIAQLQLKFEQAELLLKEMKRDIADPVEALAKVGCATVAHAFLQHL